MKKFVIPFVLMFSGLFLFSSCLKDECTSTRTFIKYDPVFLTDEEIRAEVRMESPREMENPGKIYVYGKYLFINEIREGVHIYDNSDPSSPQNIGFITIPGNVDISIKENILYADNYIDLLAINLSDLQNPEVIYRDENAFDDFYTSNGVNSRIVYYERTEISREISCEDEQWGSPWFRGGDNNGLFVNADIAAGEGSSSGGGNTIPSSGVGGSMARFTIANDRLYAIDQSNLHVYNITQAANPVEASDVSVGWGIETIFPYDNHLFIGANNGMYIYDASNDPDQPEFISRFEHAQACDPVFVQDNLAYVTLRGGTECQNFNNQLDIIDVSDYRNPKLLATHSMKHPHGLSVYEDELLICEGKFGWKTFTVNKPESIDLTNHVKNIHAFDVIRLGEKLAMIIGSDGLYQYKLDDGKIELISEIIPKP